MLCRSVLRIVQLLQRKKSVRSEYINSTATIILSSSLRRAIARIRSSSTRVARVARVMSKGNWVDEACLAGAATVSDLIPIAYDAL